MVRVTLLTASLAAVLFGVEVAGMAQPAAAQSLPQVEPAPQSAPVEVTDDQLDQFVSAYEAVQTIQDEIRADMVAAVEAEGLTVDEFNMIAQAMQTPNSPEVPPQQAEPFMAAAEQVAAIQVTAQEEIEAAIEAEDLAVEEFEQILQLAQQDPALQEQINQRLQQ